MSSADDPTVVRERRTSSGDPEAVARSVALDRLSRAPQTRAQLEAALRRRGVPDAVAAAVLDRLGEVGLVDDEAFAAAWVDSRHLGRGLAGRALAAELRRRGVAPDVVQTAVERIGPDQQEARARALVRARLPSARRLDPAAQARRLVGLLARRGYPPALAARVVREELGSDSAGLATSQDWGGDDA